ncbi:unnamed protein product [Rotaria magnacalcarata]|uniref:Innexin n=1 Tax=Rotaria magnacalcarata TaxID=392030 RepID=A0A816S1Q1_9BILA|nr:unnamed protein product [Rotaria magnacalcarata]CAF2079917.1 unnamed protein product [Rotaria magnacalcarata]CAF3764959.1 unnamed protein product [Rotaria magnacalcarata]CAF3884516.1 unnamed protein product [Rotaria magnacalcarata]
MDFNSVIENARKYAGSAHGDHGYDDLFVDRLHNRYTVAILVCFCIAISSYQYAGDPLQCWVPAQFTGNYETYTNRLCYIQNTYHVPKQQSIPQDSGLRRERTLKYYQWINFVLLLQALFFSLPRIIWQSFHDKTGLSVGHLVEAANKYESIDVDQDRGTVVQYISNCLQRYDEYVNPSKKKRSSFFHRLNYRCRLFCQARTGASLAFFYFVVRFLYIVNLICQIIFLQYFLSYHDVNYLEYGWNVLGTLLSGLSLPESKLFPRITLCDFHIRELGERHYYTVECILVINIFIEKMYFVLWLWFWLLLFITIFDSIRLIYETAMRHSRNVFITRHLELLVKNRESRETQFRYFLRYFPIDNLFTLRIIGANANSIIVAEILDELFNRKLRDGSDV